MRRSIGSELSTIAVVLSVPIAVALVFPYDSLRICPASDSHTPEAFAAIVDLTPEDEILAIRSAKENLKLVDKSEWFIDMSFGELPEDRPQSSLGLSVRVRSNVPDIVAFCPSPYLPSMAAPNPAKLEPEPNLGQEFVFSREELLKIN